MRAARFSRAEIEPRRTTADAVIIIDNVVYDVTSFLVDHPGGREVLLGLAGGDASKAFRDVGHGEDAFVWREQFKIGEVRNEDRWEVLPLRPSDTVEDNDGNFISSVLNVWGLPMLLAILAMLLYSYFFQ